MKKTFLKLGLIAGLLSGLFANDVVILKKRKNFFQGFGNYNIVILNSNYNGTPVKKALKILENKICHNPKTKKFIENGNKATFIYLDTNNNNVKVFIIDSCR